ncbi:MAG: hypothetical protein KGI71_05725 [Patescibacteria group bacterium]|nr:hypothetical protein [Patescibacteria group bacterium]
MPLYVKDLVTPRRSSVNVAITSTVVVAMTSLYGEDEVVIELVNTGSDTFNGSIYVSKTGTSPSELLPDDTFKSMAPNTVRSWRGPSAHGYIEIDGSFVATPGTIQKTVQLLRSIGRG